MQSYTLLLVTCAWLGATAKSGAEVQTLIEHNPNDQCSPAFRLKTIPAPSQNHAAIKASFTIVDGDRDPNGGGLEVLHDGKVPDGEDQPGQNFFFKAGSEGGRLLLDLTLPTDVWQIDTYSWHPNARGPQVYKLYASDGSPAGSNLQPKKPLDPETCGWKLLAKVDTRAVSDELGGQYAVNISDSQGSLGKYRY